MKILIEIPELIERYGSDFESCFSKEGYLHFKKYLSGLLLSPNKTVEAINRLFVLSRRNQSSLNKFLRRGNFDLEEISRRRIGLMQLPSGASFKSGGSDSGVLSIDSTLLSHWGTQIEQVTRLYDYVNKTYTNAHNLVNLHYSDDRTDYPIYHRLWIPPDWEAVFSKMKELDIHYNKDRFDNREKEPKKWIKYLKSRYKEIWHKYPGLSAVYSNKTLIGLDLLKRFKSNYPEVKLPIALDSGFTTAVSCQRMNEQGWSYVGALTTHQIVELAGSKKMPLGEFAAALVEQHRQGSIKFKKTTFPYKDDKKVRYAYCATHRIKDYGRQRVVIAFDKEDLSGQPYFCVSNRTDWHARGILRIFRHRWPVEVFHQEGKAEGLDKYQLRDFNAVKAHIEFVSVAYTILKRALRDDAFMSKLRTKLEKEFSETSPGLRNVIEVKSLMKLTEFIHLATLQGKSLDEISNTLFQDLVY